MAFLEEKIQLEKQLAQSMLTSIKAQMNPHFYFNALNSIQAFIYKNDTQNAIDYLGKFSKLTRNILNQTSQEKISLDEEMKMLEWYLDLEKMRFNHSFNFEIKAAPDIDVRNTKIPPMLIQPYAENAVKHGFNGKNRNGWIQIHFSQEEDVLCVEIEDNGIGRAEAAKYSNAETSFSTHANQKRLEILNAQIGRDITVKYIDKTNPEGKSIGTLVILYIPIL